MLINFLIHLPFRKNKKGSPGACAFHTFCVLAWKLSFTPDHMNPRAGEFQAEHNNSKLCKAKGLLHFMGWESVQHWDYTSDNLWGRIWLQGLLLVHLLDAWVEQGCWKLELPHNFVSESVPAVFKLPLHWLHSRSRLRDFFCSREKVVLGCSGSVMCRTSPDS